VLEFPGSPDGGAYFHISMDSFEGKMIGKITDVLQILPGVPCGHQQQNPMVTDLLSHQITTITSLTNQSTCACKNLHYLWQPIFGPTDTKSPQTNITQL
jgi:hypothetical protein